jgi:hypothetical protein
MVMGSPRDIWAWTALPSRIASMSHPIGCSTRAGGVLGVHAVCGLAAPLAVSVVRVGKIGTPANGEVQGLLSVTARTQVRPGFRYLDKIE